MNIRMHVLTTLTLLLVAGQAAAIPTLRTVIPTFHQSGASAFLNAGLVVEASTDLLVLVIGGGFTITCNTNSSLQHNVERLKTYSDFFGPREVLLVPEVVPSTYEVPGWLSIPETSCSGQCVMQYKAEVRDETSLSIRIGSTGVGANFSLIPTGEARAGNSKLTNVCRAGRSRCCTPLCSIP
jgi:hypothetical protein